MMFRGKVAAVSYLNTIPFIYGIEHAGLMRASLLLSPPSRCAAAYNSGEADIALLPIGSLPTVSNAQILPGYCIGASGPVRTVTVMSNVPVNEADTIYLDSHSATSALLVKILCGEYWNISPEFRYLDDYSAAENPGPKEAFLFIGDKVFDYEGRFAHTLDLAVCWSEMTGLPFVFAVWVAREGTDGKIISDLEESLGYGTGHIRQAIEYYGHSGKSYAYDYLSRNIDYIFDEQKHRALGLFWEMGRKYFPVLNPG